MLIHLKYLHNLQVNEEIKTANFIMSWGRRGKQKQKQKPYKGGKSQIYSSVSWNAGAWTRE